MRGSSDVKEGGIRRRGDSTMMRDGELVNSAWEPTGAPVVHCLHMVCSSRQQSLMSVWASHTLLHGLVFEVRDTVMHMFGLVIDYDRSYHLSMYRVNGIAIICNPPYLDQYPIHMFDIRSNHS